MSKPFLSVIIPVYNEQDRLANLPEIVDYLKNLKQTKKISTELIMVNDGSRDKTQAMLKKWQQKYHFKLINYHPNQGKGYAIAQGMLAATGDWRLFMDIDLSVPLTAIEELLAKITNSKSPDMVIATRRTDQAEIIANQQLIRKALGVVFFKLTSWWLKLSVSDITCGFKCFSATAATDVFSQLTINRWSFDAEMLAIAKQRGYKIVELPVSWVNDERSKVRFPQDLIQSLTDLIKIKQNLWFGRYANN